MKNNKNYSKGIFFAFIGSLSLGTAGLVDKIGTSTVNNSLIFSIQSVLFALLFTLIFGLLFFKKDFTKNLKKTSFSSWKLIFGVGVFGSGIFILFRFLGLMQSTGTFATLSQIITTFLTAILASFFLKERLDKVFWILFFVVILSMYFVSTAKIAFVTMGNGDLLILAGTFFLAVANIFSKNAIKNTFPIILSFGRFLFGFIFLITISIFLLNKIQFLLLLQYGQF